MATIIDQPGLNVIASVRLSRTFAIGVVQFKQPLTFQEALIHYPSTDYPDGVKETHRFQLIQAFATIMQKFPETGGEMGS
jgi:hypothetical protein